MSEKRLSEREEQAIRDYAAKHYSASLVETRKLLAEIDRLRGELEVERMRLVACSTASLANTDSSKAQRIDDENLYSSVAYRDVCRAVDREIEHREELERWRERARFVCPPQYGLSSPALDLIRELAQACTPTKSAP